MPTTADVLSGRWVANTSGMLWTSLPATVLVVVQELATPLPNAGWIALSAILQLLAVSLWGFLVAGASRLLAGRVVPIAAGLLWVGIGVARGVVGATVAAMAGLDPEWAYRVVFWVVVSLAWKPLLTYALAHGDERRQLLAVRRRLAIDHEHATTRAGDSADDREQRMTAALDDALGPALDEIRAGLRESAATLDALSVAAIADRLDDLAARTAAFTTTAPVATAPRPPDRVSVMDAARDFEVRRPALAAFLTALTTAPLVLPDAYRAGGASHLIEVAVALAVASLFVFGAFGILSSRVPRTRRVVGHLGVFAAGLIGAAVIALLPWTPSTPHDATLLVFFPLAFVSAAFATATSVALHDTNAELRARVDAEQRDLAHLAARTRDADEVAAHRIETLVRGQLSGRLAACAMALGLLNADELSADARATVIDGVLTQLDAAAAELYVADA